MRPVSGQAPLMHPIVIHSNAGLTMTSTATRIDLPTGIDLKVAQVCQALPEGADLGALTEAIRAVLPGLDIRHVLSRGGWHRLGGVVDLDGRRIAGRSVVQGPRP